MPKVHSLDVLGDLTVTGMVSLQETSSTNKVINLNADLLDGKEASEFALQSDFEDAISGIEALLAAI